MLGALALGFIVLGFVGVVFAYFGDLIMVFFLAWLLAFMLGPVVNAVTAIPLMSRTGAIFTTYLILFGGLVVVTIVVAAALFASLQDFIGDLPQLRANLPEILAPWQERLNALGFTNVDLQAQATAFLDNISEYAVQLVQPLQQLAVASLGAIGNLLLVVVLSLYMVADRDRIQAFMFWLVPTAYRAEAEILEEAVARSFGGFIRGQVITGPCVRRDLPAGEPRVRARVRRPSRPPSPGCSWRSPSSGRSSPGSRRSSWRSCPSPMPRFRSGSSSRSAGSWS